MMGVRTQKICRDSPKNGYYQGKGRTAATTNKASIENCINRRIITDTGTSK